MASKQEAVRQGVRNPDLLFPAAVCSYGGAFPRWASLSLSVRRECETRKIQLLESRIYWIVNFSPVCKHGEKRQDSDWCM